MTKEKKMSDFKENAKILRKMNTIFTDKRIPRPHNADPHTFAV